MVPRMKFARRRRHGRQPWIRSLPGLPWARGPYSLGLSSRGARRAPNLRTNLPAIVLRARLHRVEPASTEVVEPTTSGEGPDRKSVV